MMGMRAPAPAACLVWPCPLELLLLLLIRLLWLVEKRELKMFVLVDVVFIIIIIIIPRFRIIHMLQSALDSTAMLNMPSKETCLWRSAKTLASRIVRQSGQS